MKRGKILHIFKNTLLDGRSAARYAKIADVETSEKWGSVKGASEKIRLDEVDEDQKIEVDEVDQKFAVDEVK